MKHTPKLWVSEIPKQYGYIALNMDGPICIAQLNHTDGLGNLAYKTQLARAHEIANAVNMHDELVEALKAIHDQLYLDSNWHKWGETNEEHFVLQCAREEMTRTKVFKQIEQALSKAKDTT